MPTSQKISRRQFLKFAGMAAAGTIINACSPIAKLSQANPVPPTQSTIPSQVPIVIKPRIVQVQIDSWAVPDTNKLLATPLYQEFAKQTGIEIKFIPRPGYKEDTLKTLADAVQAGTSPYDIVDFEDELTTSFSRAGYMMPLNDLLPTDFWDDFPPAMKAYSDTWSTHNDELFRVVHNWEMPYWWYRKDWFDKTGIKAPASWDEVRSLGKVFTDAGKGVWASEDTLIKGGYLNVYLSWITLQAGGNPFDVGEEYRTALEYIHNLMHEDHVLNPASLQTQILQLNADYIADKLAFMREWPFFYDTAHNPENAAWFDEEKTAIALPPVGPGGNKCSTYAACWGFGLVKTAPNLGAAKEAFKFLVSPATAAEMAKTSVWYVSARRSVLAAVGDKGIAKAMKMYTDADVIGVRPYHPKFFEAITILENTATPFLTGEITLNESLKLAKDQMAQLI